MTAHWPQAIAEFIGAFGHMLFAPLSGVCVIHLFTRRCAYLSNAERRRLIYLFTQPQSAQRASGGSPSPSPSRPHLLYLTWEARHMWPAHAVKGSSGEGHSTSLRPLDLWPASSSPRVTTPLHSATVPLSLALATSNGELRSSCSTDCCSCNIRT